MSTEPTDAQVNAAALEYFGVSATYDRERMRDALRAAAAIAEEPEWEYGLAIPLHTGTAIHPARDEATARSQAWLYPMHRRRAPGPWVPATQEGAGDE